jgi:2-iminobutanoate/2-iminopropanoate deaminase
MSSSTPINPPGLPAFPGLISHGVVVPSAGLVFTSGQVAWDETGAPVGDDLATQFALTYENVDRVLEAAGTHRRNIVKETIYLVGYRHADAEQLIGLIAAVRGDAPVPPSSTATGVESLYAPGFLVEIEVVATL